MRFLIFWGLLTSFCQAQFENYSLIGCDINGDKIKDLILAQPQQQQVAIYFGQQNITALAKNPQQIIKQNIPQFAYRIACAGDVQKDGFEDILVSALTDNKGEVYLLKGSNDGLQFDANRVYKGVNTSQLGNHLNLLGDINKDGFSDFAIGGRSNLNYSLERLWVILGSSTFNPTPSYTHEGMNFANPSTYKLGDIDLDGIDDWGLMVETWTGGNTTDYDIVWISGKDGFDISHAKSLYTTSSFSDSAEFGNLLYMGNINNDAKPEFMTLFGYSGFGLTSYTLFSITQPTLTQYPALQTVYRFYERKYQRQQDTLKQSIQQLSVGDFNGDGKNEFAYTEAEFRTTLISQCHLKSVLNQNENFTEQQAVLHRSDASCSTFNNIGDFNADGFEDIALLISQNNQLQPIIYLGSPNGLSQQTISVGLSAEELPLDAYFTVYPNPFTNQINFKSTSTDIQRIKIIDILGRILHEQEIYTSEIQKIHLNLPSGTYFFCTYSDKGKQACSMLQKSE